MYFRGGMAPRRLQMDCLSPEQLVLYVRGGGADPRGVEAHVRDCPGCGMELLLIRETLGEARWKTGRPGTDRLRLLPAKPQPRPEPPVKPPDPPPVKPPPPAPEPKPEPKKPAPTLVEKAVVARVLHSVGGAASSVGRTIRAGEAVATARQEFLHVALEG